MNDTPRTDALHFYYKDGINMQRHELLKLSRTLERELVEAREQLRVAFLQKITDSVYQVSFAEAKKDAERYRWLRKGGIDHLLHGRLYEHCGIEGYDTEVMISGEVLDAAIDAAMKEGK